MSRLQKKNSQKKEKEIMKEKFKEKLKFSNEAERKKAEQAYLFICFFVSFEKIRQPKGGNEDLLWQQEVMKKKEKKK